MRAHTVVLQSYRTHDVPAWISRCMDSVEDWARTCGHDYARLDDAFFGLAPDWVKRTCAHNVYAVTDVCRLRWMEQKLEEGFQRVIWADADLLVFAPERVGLDHLEGYGFSHVQLRRRGPAGGWVARDSAMNALMFFDRGNPVLPFYLYACLERLRHADAGAVARCALGPDLIRALVPVLPLHLIHGVGSFNHETVEEVAYGGRVWLPFFRANCRTPIGAANLCHFLRNQCPPSARPAFDATQLRAVERLLQTRGGVLDSETAEEPALAGAPAAIRISTAGFQG